MPDEENKTKKPESEDAVEETKAYEFPEPEAIRKLARDYKAKIAHTFILHGNINDYQDNSGCRSHIIDLLATKLDVNYRLMKATTAAQKKEILQADNRVMACYSLNEGLTFVHEKSRKDWETIMAACYPDEAKDSDDSMVPWNLIIHPPDLMACLKTLSMWFAASKALYEKNQAARKKGEVGKPETCFRIIFKDGDAIFPNGQMSQLNLTDRLPIVHLRNWAADEAIGNKNMIIILSRHSTDIHDSISGGSSRVSSILVKHPKLEEREEWLHNFTEMVRRYSKEGHPVRIASRNVHDVAYAEGVDEHLFAVQSAGMSRCHLEDVLMQSWLDNVPVDFTAIRARKQRAIEEEYQGLVEFYEPEHGFDLVGGHEELKLYFRRMIIRPLMVGDKRSCSKGVLLTGPPGTGKTFLANALAKEARMNFMIGHLDRLFGGIVGETETKTRKFLEAVESAAPVILFLDELDSVLSAGRTSIGDSGTSSRVFNSLMTFLSDDSRAGKIVIIGATNRPDVLDTALIRSGRFDAVLPALPPSEVNSEGRAELLQAIAKKHHLRWAKDLKETAKLENKEHGLGRLIWADHVWTGADIEVVAKDALNNAIFRILEDPEIKKLSKTEQRKAADSAEITRADWELSMDNILPNTQLIEALIDLALEYVTHFGYCPKEWRERGRDRNGLRKHRQEMYSQGILETDREV